MNKVMLSALALLATNAWASDCKIEHQIEETLDLSGTSQLTVLAAAGELEIEGKPGLREARIRATVCASSQELADAAELQLTAGQDAQIAVNLPDSDGGFWDMGQQVYMNLEVEVPEDLPLDVKDSSGDLDIENVAALRLQDSSGDIEVKGVAGLLTITDSSGDIDIESVEGDVVIEADSSGSIYGHDIAGVVLVKRDSSGDLHFTDVKGDVIVHGSILSLLQS